MNNKQAHHIKAQVDAFCRAKGIPFSKKLYRRLKREYSRGLVKL